MVKEINIELENSTKPIVKPILKNDKTKVIAIGLKSGIELTEHKAPSFAKIIVIQGSVNYISERTNIKLEHLDEFDIPLNEVHRVIGIENAIFLLIVYYE